MKTKLLKHDLVFKLPANIFLGKTDSVYVNIGLGKSRQIIGNEQSFWSISPKIEVGNLL